MTWTVPNSAIQEPGPRQVTNADTRNGQSKAYFGRFNWLREYLSSDFPLARIMLFGHNADWFLEAPTVTSNETATNLLRAIKQERAEQKVP